MLRILYSSKLFPYSDPHFSFVAWSFGMRSNQFPSYTQRGTQQRWILHMLSKEDIQGVGKALNGGGICLWHDLLGKLEPMWIYRRSSLKCSISAFIMGERCSLQRPNSTQGTGEDSGRILAQKSRDCTVSTGSTSAWLVTWSESCHNSEPLFLHPQISLD